MNKPTIKRKTITISEDTIKSLVVAKINGGFYSIDDAIRDKFGLATWRPANPDRYVVGGRMHSHRWPFASMGVGDVVKITRDMIPTVADSMRCINACNSYCYRHHGAIKITSVMDGPDIVFTRVK